MLLPGLRRLLAVVVVGASRDAEAWPAASWRGQPNSPPLERRPIFFCFLLPGVQKTVNKFVLFFPLPFFDSLMWFMLLLGRFALLCIFVLIYDVKKCTPA